MCISFGLFLVLHPSLLHELIPFCGSIIIFVDGVYQIRNSFVLKKNKYKYWYINLIVAFIFILFAVYVMINASKITDLLISIIGGVLLVDALLDIYTTIIINRRVKAIVDSGHILEAETKED